MPDNGYEVSLWGVENALELERGDGRSPLKYTKTAQLHTLKKVNFMVCELWCVGLLTCSSDSSTLLLEPR